MVKFGFINHYLSTRPFSDRLGGLLSKCLSPAAITRLMPYLPCHKVLELGPLRSRVGAVTKGIGVMCPLLPQHFATLPNSKVLEKVSTAVRMARRWGADIVGLGGFTSICCDEGADLVDKVNVPITSGNTLTACLAIQGLLAGAKAMGIDLAKAKMAVIGGTGDIGSACTRKLAGHVGSVCIAARNEKRLEEFAAQLRQQSGVPSVEVTRHIDDATRDADLILCATSAITTIINPEVLKPGVVICDVAYPANVGVNLRRERPDILVFEGGLATLPDPHCTGSDALLEFAPHGTIHGCFAETIVLALENRLESFSIGRGRITVAKLDDMWSLAVKHGFNLAPFNYGGVTYTEETIRQIRLQAIREN